MKYVWVAFIMWNCVITAFITSTFCVRRVAVWWRIKTADVYNNGDSVWSHARELVCRNMLYHGKWGNGAIEGNLPCDVGWYPRHVTFGTRKPWLQEPSSGVLAVRGGRCPEQVERSDLVRSRLGGQTQLGLDSLSLMPLGLYCFLCIVGSTLN